MIDDDVKITINLNKLVDVRARLLTEYENYAVQELKDLDEQLRTEWETPPLDMIG